MFSLSQILDITQGTALQLACPDAPIEHLLIDSRKPAFAPTSLFFAIVGERHDGHQFVGELLQKGVRNFIITNPTFSSFEEGEANIILVPDAVRALQQIAAAHRAKFPYPVIGITGSNGKTIVKEWLYQLLSPDFRIVRSPKSYNSQVGVPLSVWEMSAHHNLAIFEAGISQAGEMAALEAIIRPTVGIFTNLGTAHDEGFANSTQKFLEKSQLFKGCEVIYSLSTTPDPQDSPPFKEGLGVVESENQDSPPFKEGLGVVESENQDSPPFKEGLGVVASENQDSPPFKEGQGVVASENQDSPPFKEGLGVVESETQDSPPFKEGLGVVESERTFLSGKISNLSHLKDKRRELRSNMTPAEATLWKCLKNSQLEGKKFRRQHSIDNFILDFYCPSERLGIELDGAPHFTEEGVLYDEYRTECLNALGIQILRFENREVFNSIEAVLERIKAYFRHSTTPDPSLEGGELLAYSPPFKEGQGVVESETQDSPPFKEGQGAVASENQDSPPFKEGLGVVEYQTSENIDSYSTTPDPSLEGGELLEHSPPFKEGQGAVEFENQDSPPSKEGLGVVELQTNFEILERKSQTNQTTFLLAHAGKEFSLKIASTDAATLENSLTCLCVLLHFGVPTDEIQARFDALRPVAMRLEMKEAINQSYLIDDSYNNDLSGLRMALNFLKLQRQASQNIVILSDMYETNLPNEILYGNIAQMLQEMQIDVLVGIGEGISAHKTLFEQAMGTGKTHFFQETAQFLSNSLCNSFQHALILVKGARAFAFEQIVKKLERKAHRTVLEINYDALTHNLNFYRSLLKPQTKIMAMVKAFAYGSGSAEVAQWLQFHRVDYLGVAYPDEGVFLRKNGITLPIMVMNPAPESFALCAEYALEPEIYSFRMLEELAYFLQTFANPPEIFKIHLKLDTGMRRLGFEAHEIAELASRMAQTLPAWVRVASAFSHMAGADEAKHNDFSHRQIDLFRQGTAVLEEKLGYIFLKHIANSPTITRFPEAHFDMVRLGVGLYGVEASQIYPDSLATVATFKTIISQIKHIRAGETVGYGRHGQAERDLRIATIAVGYADGFLRRLSKGVGKVGVNGKRAPVVGNVCMDMTMIDVTDIEAKEGDEVIIFGEAPNPTIFDMAAALQTIPYEVLTLVSERVKRVFFTT